jgi:hypothetical protein
MKSFFIAIFLLISASISFAANLTATTIASGFGKSDGKINLVITGGFAPYTITWTGPSGYTNNTTHPDSLAPGTYCVTVSDYYCGVATLCVVIKENPNTSVAEISNDNWSVYPSPFSNRFHVDFGTRITGLVRLHLYDMLGKSVFDQSVNTNNQSGYDFDPMQPLPSGIYILSLQTQDGIRLVRRLLCSGY